MATSLPTNIDATYPDGPTDPADPLYDQSRKVHQQQHDQIHGYTNSHDTASDPHGDRAYALALVNAATIGATAVRNGSGAPANSVGNNGDFYIDTATSNLYGPKAAGVWPAAVSLRGAAGTSGNTILSGTVDPVGVGVNNDFYVNTTTSRFFGPKAAGVWPSSGIALAGGTAPSPVDTYNIVLAEGAIAVGDLLPGGLFIQDATVLTFATLHADSAPLGAAVTVDIRDSAGYVYASPTIAASGTDSASGAVSPGVLVAAGTRLRFVDTTVGSTSAGSGVTLFIKTDKSATTGAVSPSAPGSTETFTWRDDFTGTDGAAVDQTKWFAATPMEPASGQVLSDGGKILNNAGVFTKLTGGQYDSSYAQTGTRYPGAANFEVVGSFKPPSPSAYGRMSIVMRADRTVPASTDDDDCVGIEFDSQAALARGKAKPSYTAQYAFSSSDTTNSLAFPTVGASGFICFRISLVGALIKLRMWKAEDTEPSTYPYSWAVPSGVPSAGLLKVWHSGPTGTQWTLDYLAVK